MTTSTNACIRYRSTRVQRRSANRYEISTWQRSELKSLRCGGVVFAAPIRALT